MKNLKFILIPIMGIISISIYAGTSDNCDNEACLKLIYNGGSTDLPLDSQNSMTIDPITGDIIINTGASLTAESISEDYLNVSGSIDAPTVVPHSPAVQYFDDNSYAKMKWNITNAVYCKELWSPFNYIHGSSSQTLIQSPYESSSVSVETSYTIECCNSTACTQPASATVVDNILVVNPPDVLITSPQSSSNIAPGTDVVLNWTLGNAPASCTTSWGSNISTTSPGTETISNVTQSTTYTITCINSAAPSGISNSVSVSVTGNDSWPVCSGAAAPPTGLLEDRTILTFGVNGVQVGSPYSYNGFYSDLQGYGTSFPFPGEWGDQIHANLEKNHYIAAKFTVDDLGKDGKFLRSIPSNNEGIPASGWTLAISKCPGDFNTLLNNDPRCNTKASTLYWSTKENPAGPDGFFCELEQGETYYLNYIQSQGTGGNYLNSSCGADACGILAVTNAVNI